MGSCGPRVGRSARSPQSLSWVFQEEEEQGWRGLPTLQPSPTPECSLRFRGEGLAKLRLRFWERREPPHVPQATPGGAATKQRDFCVLGSCPSRFHAKAAHLSTLRTPVCPGRRKRVAWVGFGGQACTFPARLMGIRR